MGLAVFPSHHLLQATAAMITTPPPPHGGVEVRMNPQQGLATIRNHHPAPPHCVFQTLQVLLFPALSFVRAGRLSSLEFVTRELSSQTHILFQIYRPRCRYPGLHLLLPSKSNSQTQLAGQHQKVLTEIHRPPVTTCMHTDSPCLKLLLVNRL